MSELSTQCPEATGHRSLHFVFIVCDGVGHLNPLLGIADALIERKHRVTIMTAKRFEKIVRNNGFEFIVWPPPKETDTETKAPSVDPIERWRDSSKFMAYLAPLERASKRGKFQAQLLADVKRSHEYTMTILEQLKPDLILLEHLTMVPAVHILETKIPWIRFQSGNPSSLYPVGSVPPVTSGLPSYDQSQWAEFSRLADIAMSDIAQEIRALANSLIPSSQQPRIKFNLLCDSSFLNIYQFPLELDYDDIAGKLPDNFMRIDAALRKFQPKVLQDDSIEYTGAPRRNPIPLEVPEHFQQDANRKRILLTLGSVGSSFRSIMEKLINILSKSNYNIIVATGTLHEYELGANMVGGGYINQLAILPQMDLVITHGGLNTVNECLHHGKPMVIIPLFAEQPCNAQRIQEKGLGIRLNATDVNDDSLLDACEKLLADEQLAKRLQQVSSRIRSSTTLKTLIDRMEAIAYQPPALESRSCS